MVIALLALIVMVVGIVIYCTTSNPKWIEISRAMMWTGMLVTLWVAGRVTISL